MFDFTFMKSNFSKSPSSEKTKNLIPIRCLIVRVRLSRFLKMWGVGGGGGGVEGVAFRSSSFFSKNLQFDPLTIKHKIIFSFFFVYVIPYIMGIKLFSKYYSEF